VFWTLAIEEQLYLAYYLLLVIRGRVGWIRTLSLLLAARFVTFGLGAILRLAFNVYTPINEAAISNWFIWALGAVSVEAAFGLLTLPSWCRKARLGLAVLLFAGVMDYADRNVDGHGVIHLVLITVITPLWAIGFFMLLNWVVSLEIGWRSLRRVPSVVRVFAAVGIFSYSLYLTHGLIQHQFISFIPFFRNIPDATMVWVRLLILSPLAVLFAWVFFQLFEKPFLAPPAYKPQTAASPATESSAADAFV
jgi:peptidoglycan/LPS O-acetylase OafA/YrhL